MNRNHDGRLDRVERNRAKRKHPPASETMTSEKAKARMLELMTLAVERKKEYEQEHGKQPNPCEDSAAHQRFRQSMIRIFGPGIFDADDETGAA